MTQLRLILALTAVLLLAACGQPAPAEPSAPAAAPPALPLRMALTGDGLMAVRADTGGTELLPFSRSKGQTLVTMTRAEPARGQESVNSECGAGPLTFVAWLDGLTLVFQDDRFAGWTVNKPGLTTMDGIGVGSTRADLLAARPTTTVEESTLGTEFAVGEMGGLFDGKGPTAKITNLWAGVTCMFR